MNPASHDSAGDRQLEEILHTYLRATSHTLPASQIQPQLSESFRLAGARKTNRA